MLNSMQNQALYHETLLEVAGQGGFDMYRVPGAIVTANGTALVCYDARREKGDDPTQSLFYRRSLDRGQTWSDRIELVSGIKGERVHNIVMLAEKNETVHCFWNLSYTHCFHQISFDGGKTWGQARDISQAFEAFKPRYNWNVYSIGPGHGICLKSGRLVVPAWLSCGGSTHQPSVFACIYSDDGGMTWLPGGILHPNQEILNPNEGTMVELNDGSLLVSIRHDTLDHRCRLLASSPDCAKEWKEYWFDSNLPDPICHASLCRSGKNSKGILFSNCAWDDQEGVQAIKDGQKIKWSPDARKNLTVRLSMDQGKKWAYSKMLAKQGGYSDLSAQDNGENLYCVFEKDWQNGNCIFPEKLVVASFNKEWIMS